MRINYETLTSDQKNALKKIHELGNEMLRAWNENDLFDIYCQADDLWNEYFPFQAEQEGDHWYLTRRYNDLSREFRKNKNPESLTVNLFGCTVKINIK